MALKSIFFAGGQVWVTDGTVSGTQQLAAAGAALPDPVVLGNLVVFTQPVNLTWGVGVTNGTKAGTSTVQPPNATALAPSSGYEMVDSVNIGAKVIAENGIAGRLVVTDGTAAGTQALSPPILPAPNTWGFDSALYSLGNKVVFSASNTHPASTTAAVYDLWVSDGTSAGTVPLVVPDESRTRRLESLRLHGVW